MNLNWKDETTTAMRRAVSGSVLLLLGFWRCHAAAVGTDTGQPAEIYHLSPVGSIVVQPDGKILVANGGYPTRGRLAIMAPATGTFGVLPGGLFRFHPDGSLDHSFACQIGPVSGQDLFHTRIELQADGRVLAQGEQGELIRLQSDGRLDDCLRLRFPTNETPALWVHPEALRSFAVCVDSSLVVAGPGPEKPIGNPQSVVQRFSDAGQWLEADQRSATPSLIATITAGSGLELRTPVRGIMPNGQPWGSATLRSNVHLVRATSNGPVRVATSVPMPLEQQFSLPGATDALRELFRESPVELCRCAVRLPGGGAIVAVAEPGNQMPPSRGRFVRFDSQWRADWSYTNAFELRGPNRMSLAVDSRGCLLVAGNLRTLNGEFFAGLARLLPDGRTDQSFKVSIDSPFFPPVAALAVEADDRVLVGGYFEQVNGQDCGHLVRVNVDGSLDDALQARFDRVRFWNSRLTLPANRGTPDTNASLASGTTGDQGSGVANGAKAILLKRLEIEGTNVVIRFTGPAGTIVVLESRESWNQGRWAVVGTTVIDLGGFGGFTDVGAARRPMRFYRVRSF